MNASSPFRANAISPYALNSASFYSFEGEIYPLYAEMKMAYSLLANSIDKTGVVRISPETLESRLGLKGGRFDGVTLIRDFIMLGVLELKDTFYHRGKRVRYGCFKMNAFPNEIVPAEQVASIPPLLFDTTLVSVESIVARHEQEQIYASAFYYPEDLWKVPYSHII